MKCTPYFSVNPPNSLNRHLDVLQNFLEDLYTDMTTVSDISHHFTMPFSSFLRSILTSGTTRGGKPVWRPDFSSALTLVRLASSFSQ
jgi:hypothetical protein